MNDLRLLTDLPTEIQHRSFEAFKRLYDEAFPLPDERQEPEEWLKPPKPGMPQSVVGVAGAGFEAAETVVVAGGIVAEYFPRSRCGLIAYLAVDSLYRRQGLARRLVDAAVDGLLRVAEKRKEGLRAVFGEAEDFRRQEVAAKGDHPPKRLAILDRLGATWIEAPYVMPRLDANKRRDANLLLLAFPHPRVTLNATTVPLTVVGGFLDEYFELEEDNPDDFRRGDDLASLRSALESLSRRYHQTYEPKRPWEDYRREECQVPLRALPQPAAAHLHLRDVAVCLHIVTLDLDQGETEEDLVERFGAPDLVGRFGRTRLDPSEPEYICPIYHSFEIDVLSYRFQTDPPVKSACTSEAQFRILIRFPQEIAYVAEGMRRQIVGARRQLEVRASLTASRFPATGVRIWHLAFLPVHGEELTELDIIRLISFYYREQEQTEMSARTTFEVEGDGEERSFRALLATLSLGRLHAEWPTAGTIELNPAVGESDGGRDLWTRILSSLYLTTIDDQDGFRELEELYQEPRIKQRLDACCGIVSGIFDYNRMSFAEMQDTLAPDSSAGGYAVWLNRRTMTNVDLQDAMLQRCGRTIGINPYLILPHAVLLHNEVVVDQVEEVARRALLPLDRLASKTTTEKDRIETLTRARRRIEHSLHRHFIPNIFHYVGERELYEVGSQTRGVLEKKQAGERLLADLNAHLRDEQEEMKADAREKHDLGERRRGFLLTVLSVLLSLTVVQDLATRSAKFPWEWWSIALLAATVAAAVIGLLLAFPRSRRGL